MVYAQPRIRLREWDAQIPLGFWHTNWSPNLGQMTRSYNNQQKKKRELAELWTFLSLQITEKNWKNVKRIISTSTFARELKKMWNVKVMIIPIVIGTVTKGSVQGLEDLEITGWEETIQTTALLKSTRILRRILETWGDLLSLKLQWETIS